MFWARKRAAGSGGESGDGEPSRNGAQADVTWRDTAASRGVEPPRGDERGEADEADQGDQQGPLEPSARLTGHQFLYVFVLDGLGGMVLGGGINFAIAYAMYTTQDSRRHPIRLFELPRTLAGDAAVTMVVQCLLTWFIEMALVMHDLAQRSVQPVGFVREPARPWARWARWVLMLGASGEADGAGGAGGGAGPAGEGAGGAGPGGAAGAPGPGKEAAPNGKTGPATGNRRNRRNRRRTALSLAGAALQQALRALLVAVAAFAVLWPPAVGILTAVGTRSGGDWVFGDRWAPQVFKLVLGGMLGLLATPAMALFWLVRAGWEAAP